MCLLPISFLNASKSRVSRSHWGPASLQVNTKSLVRHLCSFPRQNIQYHNNPSLCPNQWCWRSWSRMVLWRPPRPSRNNTQKRCPFHYRGLECKNRKSRDTWNNRHIWPWSKEWSRAKANRVFCQENTLVIANTLFQHHKRRLYTWISPDGQYWIRLMIFFAAKDGEVLYCQPKQDLALTVAQIINSLLQNSALNWRK